MDAVDATSAVAASTVVFCVSGVVGGKTLGCGLFLTLDSSESSEVVVLSSLNLFCSFVSFSNCSCASSLFSKSESDSELTQNLRHVVFYLQ